MAKNHRSLEGLVMAIPLPDGTYGYCRKMGMSHTEVYELRSREVLSVEELKDAPIAFKIALMNFAFTGKRWKKIGRIPLTNIEELEEHWYFMQDFDGSLFRTRDWFERVPASLDEIQSLERAAAWEPSHVEDRLMDFFSGRPNKWLESLKAKVL